MKKSFLILGAVGIFVFACGIAVIAGVIWATHAIPQPQTQNSQVLAWPDSYSGDYVPVMEVVDGDTIKVFTDGKIQTVRFIGIDTPETVDPRKPVQCFGKEASDKEKSLLTGQKVKLEADPTQGDTDKYGRLLRYIYMQDGTFVNLKMVTEGYAFEYTYDKPYEFQQQFKAAEHNAYVNNLGLWGQACASTLSKYSQEAGS